MYRTFSLNCLRLQQTKKYTRAIFLPEKVSEIYRLNQRNFSVFLSIADPKHITSVAINVSSYLNKKCDNNTDTSFN